MDELRECVVDVAFYYINIVEVEFVEIVVRYAAEFGLAFESVDLRLCVVGCKVCGRDAEIGAELYYIM